VGADGLLRRPAENWTSPRRRCTVHPGTFPAALLGGVRRPGFALPAFTFLGGRLRYSLPSAAAKFPANSDPSASLEPRLGISTPSRGQHARGQIHALPGWRLHQTLAAKDSLTHKEKWKHVRTLIRVISERRGVGEPTTNERVFMTSIDGLDAQTALSLTRAHWSIENNLHWVLDVSFREDECRVYAANAAENLVVVRHIALNLLRSVNGLRGGIASKRKQAGWSDDVRARVLCASPE
jgi:hypothetical protein